MTKHTEQQPVQAAVTSALQRTMNDTGATAGTVWTSPEDGSNCATISLSPDFDFTGTVLPRGVGIVGAVAESQSPHLTNDASAEPGHFSDIKSLTGTETKGMITFPIVIDGRTAAIVQVLNKQDGQNFSLADYRACERLAAEVERQLLLNAVHVAQSFLPAPARDLIGFAPSSLRSRVTNATVLVVDVANSTHLLGQLAQDKRQLQPALSKVFSLVVPQLVSQHGWVAHYPGDAVLAIFEPLPQGERAEVRAFLSALITERSLERLRLGGDRILNGLQMHFGFAHGTLEIGPVGPPGERRFSVDGEPVYEAFRLIKQRGHASDSFSMADSFARCLFGESASNSQA